MALDPSRAALVSQEFRYRIIDDENILALHSNSRIIELQTNLDEAGAGAFAQELWNLTSQSSRTFTVTIRGTLTLEDFKDGPPRYRLRFDHHSGADPSIIYTVIEAKVRHLTGTTTLTVRS